MKHSNTRLSALITILLVSTLGFGQNPSSVSRGGAQRGRSATAATTQPTTTVQIENELKEALTVIEGNYVDGKKIDYNEIFKSSIDSMLHTLDPHSNYFDAKETEAFNNDQSSRYFGIGATIGDLSDANGDVVATYIKATFDGAPAFKAGLRYGDKIVKFSGQRAKADGTLEDVKNVSLLGKPFPEVRSYLRGPEGTTIELTVERLDTGKQETVFITRGAVPQPSISEAYMIRPGVGYLAMRGGFNRTTFDPEFVEAMRELKAQGMQQLVIDLRDNGGGLVTQALNVADTFLNQGQTILTQKGRVEGVSRRYPARNRTPERVPIVMLVNRNTASASEILSGALQDHDRALIVGETTFGKGLVQNPFPLEYGSMLLLTIAKYETPSGRLIQRDYSNGDLYNYYTDGGSFRSDDDTPTKPTGAESKTDTGRTVYSGGGITPDVVVKPKTIPIERARFQTRLSNPVFAFALDLIAGRVKGFDAYKITKPIEYGRDLKAADYPITDPVFAAFRQYAVDKYKFTAAQVDKEREFVTRTLRTEFVTAAYGSQTSLQVFNDYDDQLLKAIDLLPQAKQLAMQSERARTTALTKISGN